MIETFNAKVRAECLDQQWFESLEEAREQLEEWRKEYNRERPHSSLNNLTSEEYLARWRTEKQLEKPKTNVSIEILLRGRSRDGGAGRCKAAGSHAHHMQKPMAFTPKQFGTTSMLWVVEIVKVFEILI